MMRVEFTVEPYVEGEVPPYVKAAVDAIAAPGRAIDVGPFGTTVVLSDEDSAQAVAAALQAAFDTGASRVSLQVTALR